MRSDLGTRIWLAWTAVVVALLPLAPPDAAIGALGWAVVAPALGAGLAWRARDEVLGGLYLAVAQIALLQWLAGPTGARLYGGLYLVIAASGAFLHRLHAQPAVAREAADDAQEELVGVDRVTGLPNRRAFEDALSTEMSRSRRLRAPLCLVVADLNRFSAINDEHGYLAGDECLRDAAEALRDEMRQHDACFRWGGDEFALLLPGTTRTEADAACERLSDAVARRCRRPDGSALGIACAAAQLADGMTGEDFIRAGDAALLALKGEGRPRLRAV